MKRGDEILRFRASERHLHWALAIPFMVSGVTALILVTIYNPHPMRPYRAVFSWIHRISGIAFFLLPPWTIARHRGDRRMYLLNVREAWRWTVDDLKWLALMGPAAISSRVKLPPQGKFNAAEKINFMTVTTTYPLYLLTGLLIWLPGVALSAWLAHFSMALLATPLLLGHLFMAIVNRDTRIGLHGMISGYVPREWARHHYRRWYDETFEHDPIAAPQVEPVDPQSQPVPSPVPACAGPDDWPEPTRGQQAEGWLVPDEATWPSPWPHMTPLAAEPTPVSETP